LLGRADESVVAIGRCVKWAGPNMQCVRTPILLERLC